MTRLCSSLLLSLLIASSASAVTMDWLPIGNPGNAADTEVMTCCGSSVGTSGYGAVAYSYSMGKYEVTNAQYAEFLNAKAASDPLGLYNLSMGTIGDPVYGSGLTRSGSSGSYTYSAITGRENMPVSYVSFYDALRFTNWLNNGQGSGDTETGAYTLLGGTAEPSNGTTVTRNAGATIFLPSEDEWYKAAYYSALTTSYFDYPAGSDTQTTCTTPTAAANSANCNAPGNEPDVGDFTIVGSYTGSVSPYGTFDQGGNVIEWNETIIIISIIGRLRGGRGGPFGGGALGLAASIRGANRPEVEGNSLGFRVAMIPEPGTGLLVIAGLLGLTGWRRARA